MVKNPRSFRHWGGFIASGGTSFLVDASLTMSLTSLAKFNPFIARLIAIMVAMMVGWLMHRRFTFAVAAPPSVKEFLRFAAVAWSANAVNYGIYALILLTFPATWPLAALVASTAVATIFSYLGFRLGVFRDLPPPA